MACEMVSLKNDIRRAVTKTPRSAHNGPSSIAATRPRSMNASVNMVVVVGRDVQAVSFFK